MEAAAITTYLHSHIPLTRAMDVRAAAVGIDSITLTAPLGPNVNHTETAFGGSLSTLGIVAGWSLLHTAMADNKVSARLLIQRSETDFLRPADGDLKAECSFSDAGALPKFLSTLAERRRSRIELAARIWSNGSHVATHHGVYVAILY